MTLLSICVPTYNRAEFLSVLLESLVPQVDARIEIVISDNASTDHTGDVIETYRARGLNIIYSRCDENQGADRNYLRSVALASGEWCWLCGSDDVFRPDSIQTALRVLGKDIEVILGNRIECDYALTPLGYTPWLDSEEQQLVFGVLGPATIEQYFQSCRRLGGVFSFLSSILIRKSSWDRIVTEQDFIGTGYVHAYIILSMIAHGGRLLYLNHPIIATRGGNDSFATQGLVKRFLLDINGYLQIADRLYAHNPLLRRRFLKILQHEEMAIYRVASTLRNTSDASERALIIERISKAGMPVGTMRVAILLSTFPLGLKIYGMIRHRSSIRQAQQRLRSLGANT